MHYFVAVYVVLGEDYENRGFLMTLQEMNLLETGTLITALEYLCFSFRGMRSEAFCPSIISWQVCERTAKNCTQAANNDQTISF